MRNRLLSALLLCLIWCFTAAQCPVPDFIVPATACLNETIVIENKSVNSGSSIWDFCAGDLLTIPTASLLGSPISTLGTLTGIEAVEDNENHFVFLTGRTSNNLVRVDFGSDIRNPTPEIVNLGSLDHSLNGPVGIKFMKENDSWYAILYNSGDDQLLRLSFGNSLSNVPQVTSIIKGYGGANNGLELVRDGDKIVCLITEPATGKLTLIDFGNSITNTPIEPLNVLRTSTLPQAENLRGISLVQNCGTWYGYTVSSGNNSILRLDFGSELFSIPAATNITGIATADNYVDVKVFQDAGQYIGFVMTVQGVVYRLDFSTDPTSFPVKSSLGNLSALTDHLYFSFANRDSKWSFFAGSYVNGQLYRGDFINNCSFTQRLGDGEDNNPKIEYSTSGSYKISLTSRNSAGEISSATKMITITSEIAPDISFTTENNCVSSAINLTPQNSSGTISSYEWSFGDGSQVSGDMFPSHEYASAGTYLVTVTVTGSNLCANRSNRTLVIYDAPEPGFSMPSGLMCTNNEFSFVNSTPDDFDGLLLYEWYVDNSLVATTRNLNYTFASTGIKTIKLITSIPGCSSQDAQTTSDLQSGPAIDFSFVGKCEDSDIHFESQLPDGLSSFSWQFPEAASVPDVNPTYTFQNAGEYQVSLLATNDIGCNTTKTKTVKIYSKPSPDFSIEAPPQSCSGTATPFQNTTPDLTDSNITSWRWIFGDDDPGSDISELKSPSHIFADAGTYKVLLKAKTDKECEATLEKEITIAQSPNAEFSNTATCKEALSTFTSSGADIKTYYWEIGTSYYLNKSVNHTFNTSGEHDVKLSVTGTNNCNSFKAKRVKVPVPLTPSFSVWKNCVAYEAEFTDNTSGADPVAWRQWNFDGTIKENVQQTKFPISEFEVLPTTLTVKGESGCVYSKRMDVNVFHAPVANFEVTPLRGAAPLEVSFENLSESATKYQWTFFDATTFTSEEFEPTFTFNQIGEHAIELKAANEVGCESVVSKTIDAENPAADVEIKVMTVSQNPDKTLKVIVTLQNNGNTILRDLPVNIDISGIFSFKEIIEEPIRPKEQYNLVLSYGITKNQDLNFLCAQAELAGDLTFEGNKACTQFEKTVLLLSPYPNPVTETLNIEWIGKVNHRVNVLITDSFGKAILQKDIDSIDGFNHQFFDVTQLKEGLYFLVLNDGFTQKTQRIIISRKN